MKNETLTGLDDYYEKQNLATKECLLALKSFILSVDCNIVPIRKYQIPFFRFKESNLGFLWVHKKKILIGSKTLALKFLVYMQGMLLL